MPIRRLFLILSLFALWALPSFSGTPLPQRGSWRGVEPACRQWKGKGLSQTGDARRAEAGAPARPEGRGESSDEWGYSWNNGFSESAWVGGNGRAILLQNGLDLTFLDACDPSRAAVWDAAELPWGVTKAVFAGDTAYLNISASGLQAWNVADPAHPVMTAQYDPCTWSGFYDFAIVDHYALVVGNREGLGVLDLDGDGTMYKDDLFDCPYPVNHPSKIVVSGRYALLIDSNSPGIVVYDIADPAHPALLWWAQVPALARASDVDYHAPYLVLNYRDYGFDPGPYAGDTLMGVLRMDDPGDPSSLDPRPVNAACPLQAGRRFGNMEVRWPMAYFASADGVQMVDLTDPAFPTPAGTVDVTANHYLEYGRWVHVEGDRLYLADGSGLSAFDLQGNRLSHLMTGGVLFGGWNYYKPFSVLPEGDLGLVTMVYDGVALADFTGEIPKRAGQWENTTGGANGRVIDSLLSLDGRYAFVATVDWTPDAPYRGSVKVVDFADPWEPAVAGEYRLPSGESEWFPVDLTRIDEDHIAVVMADNVSLNYRMDVLNVSRPGEPVAVGGAKFTPGLEVDSVAYADGYADGKAYLVVACSLPPEGWVRLVTVDVTDPEKPALSLDVDLGTPGWAGAVEVVHAPGFTYGVLPNYTTFWVLDLSDPSSASTTRLLWPGGMLDAEVPQVARAIPNSSPPGQFAVSTGWADIFERTCYYSLDAGFRRLGTRGIGTFVLQPADRQDGRVYYTHYIKTLGMDPHLPVSHAPQIVGPASIQPNHVISSPTQISVEGVRCEDGISEVLCRVDMRTDNYLSCSQLIGVQTEPSSPGTYTFTLDPQQVPFAGSNAQVWFLAYNPAGSYATYLVSPITLAPTEPLQTSAGASATAGTPPLTVQFQSAASGGMPPYHFRWNLPDVGWVHGASQAVTFSRPGSFTCEAEVEDAYHQFARAIVTVDVADPRPQIWTWVRLREPFRIALTGIRFSPGCSVTVGGEPVTYLQIVDSTHLVIGKGKSFKKRVPKGVPTEVVVTNPDGWQSNPLTITR